MNELGSKLKKLRKRWNFSCSEMSTKVGISTRYLHSVESNQANISLAVLESFAKVFSTSADVLIGISPTMVDLFDHNFMQSSSLFRTYEKLRNLLGDELASGIIVGERKAALLEVKMNFVVWNRQGTIVKVPHQKTGTPYFRKGDSLRGVMSKKDYFQQEQRFLDSGLKFMWGLEEYNLIDSNQRSILLSFSHKLTPNADTYLSRFMDLSDLEELRNSFIKSLFHIESESGTLATGC